MYDGKMLIPYILIFLISAGLRFGLVSYNRESNDDHMQVVESILETNRLPDMGNCRECFQPKFFHYSAAKMLQIMEMEHSAKNKQIFAVELLNFFAGLITITIIGIFLYRIPITPEWLKFMAFGLLALNPKLIGISSQATNDAFAILFSTLALYFAHRYLKNARPLFFLLMIISLVCGISTKPNVWVTAIAILLALLIKAWEEKKAWTKIIAVGLQYGAIVFLLTCMNPLSQYYFNFQKFGSPIVINVKKPPSPHFFEQSTEGPLTEFRPGILSIQDGFFTFKFIELLRYPRLQNEAFPYAPHRTSLWTQLYGRAHSVHFDNWPMVWFTEGRQGFWLSRAIYIFALVPTCLMLLGVMMESAQILKAIFKQDAKLVLTNHFGLDVATLVGYFLFISLYAFEYRDFSFMKAIFIYPAVFVFPLFFLRASEAIHSHLLNKWKWVRTVFGVWIMTLLLLYTAEILSMIQLIYSRRV